VKSIHPALLQTLHQAFGDNLQTDVSLKRYTAARLGGKAEALLIANTSDELARITTRLWELEVPFTILGNGSNVLVSDAGVHQLVVLNRSHKMRFFQQSEPPTVWAEAGVNFGALARKAATYGLSGLEWAAGIPGTVGGAVYGNAGAHAGDMSGNLLMAEILHRIQKDGNDKSSIVREEWSTERFEFAYRSSWLKRHPEQVVILSVTMKLVQSTPETVQAKMDEYNILRHRSQPSGASLGSIFKNPQGDFAGRLIDAAGLKGTRIGEAEISLVHANFIINHGKATASDYYALIRLAQQKVLEKFGVSLELEIELLGDWSGQ
jgi:UDP-N-acetylmuramate dehydrogenase